MQPPLVVLLLPDDDELHDGRAATDREGGFTDLVAGVPGLVTSRMPGCDCEPTTAPARFNGRPLFENCGTVDEPARVRALLE